VYSMLICVCNDVCVSAHVCVVCGMLYVSVYTWCVKCVLVCMHAHVYVGVVCAVCVHACMCEYATHLNEQSSKVTFCAS